jgi:hypothetical protein
MISDEKLEQMAKSYAYKAIRDIEYNNRDDDFQCGFTDGFRAAEKMILEEAIEGLQEHVDKIAPERLTPTLYAEVKYSWVNATFLERRKSEARITELEAAVRDMANRLSALLWCDRRIEGCDCPKCSAMGTLEKHRALIEALKGER